MRFGTSRRQESRSATGWSITTTEDRIPRLTISRRASSMLGFGLCLWQHNVGSQIPPYVCCRTVQRMGSTSVFVSHKCPGSVWKGLNRRFETLTRRYLHGCPGVGPHSFRHIVATAVIKRTGSFTAAALILHDREETVRAHYAHLVGTDG